MYALARRANVFFRDASVGGKSTTVDGHTWYGAFTNKSIDQANEKLTKLCIREIW